MYLQGWISPSTSTVGEKLKPADSDDKVDNDTLADQLDGGSMAKEGLPQGHG